jgi:peptide/nickel transport system permease protein
MPSTDADSARFTRADWAQRTGRVPRPGARTVGLVVALVGLAALFAYDYLVGPDDLFVVIGWNLTRVDWLLLVAVVMLVRYGAVPALANRERTGRHLRALLARPGAAFAVLFIGTVTVTSIVGPDTLFALEYPRLRHRFQPPVFASAPADVVYNYECVGRVVDGRCHGSWKYPLGTTRIGENVLEQLAHGMRVALKLGVVVGTLMAVMATLVGTAAGYFGGRVDEVLMRYVDVQQTLPAIVVYLMVATLYFGNLEGVSDGGAFAFVLVFGLLDWGGMARLVRSDVLERRSAGYVRAARAAGASDLQVIRRHILPNSVPTVVTALTRRIPLVILAQVALAYLELNRVNSRSLGRLLRVGLDSSNVVWHQQWWVTTVGVLTLVLTVVSFNLLGDGLRDVLDPREEVE